MTDRTHYRPHLSKRPLVFVKWRRRSHYERGVKRNWRIYLFGLLPILTLPRKAS